MVDDTSNASDTPHISKPLLKLKLLEILRDGTFEELNDCIKSKFVPLDDPAVCEVSSCILHYAIQVAGFKLVKEIITNWVDNPELSQKTLGIKLNINSLDHDGNTPLHLAAVQSRTNVIQYLLDRSDINECITNHDGLLPIDMCKNLNVAEFMQDKRNSYINKVCDEAEKAFNERNFKGLDKIFSNPRNFSFLNVNKQDSTNGNNTLLHIHAKENDIDVCKWLLNHDANPLLKNNDGLTPIDIIKNEMRQDKKKYSNINNLFKKYLTEKDTIDAAKATTKPPSYKGYLKKYAYVGKGYKLRYFVLSEDGTLSYYKDAASSAKGKPRGYLNLATCYLHMSSTEKLKFDVIGGTNHSAKWKLKGNQPSETNSWVLAIQSAIRYAKDQKKGSSYTHNQNLHQKKPSISSKNISRSSTNDFAIPKLDIDTGSPLRRKLTVDASDLRPSSSKTLLTNKVELNENLTPSGKLYVNKLIGDRLHRSSSFSSYDSMRDKSKHLSPLTSPKFMISTSGISYVNTGANTSTRSLVSGIYGAGDSASTEYQDELPYDSDSDVEDWEEEVANKYNRDDEYLKVEYGPFVEKLNIYQKSIALEISSINDLLNSKDFLTSSNALETLKDSVQKLSTNISSMNNITLKRDEKLISMLTKQRDMNNVWITTMRDLELELEEKTERLETFGKGRNTLKRTLRKKMEEGRSSSNIPSSVSIAKLANEAGSSDTIEQIAKFISETKQEDELSEDDEFYDAEELLDELEMQQTKNINLPINNELSERKPVSSLSSMKGMNVKPIGEYVMEKDKPTNNEVTIPQMKKEFSKDIEQSVKKKLTISNENEVTSLPLPSYPPPKVEEVKSQIPTIKTSPVSEGVENLGGKIKTDIVPVSGEKDEKLDSKVLLPKNPIGVTKLQKCKEQMIWKEGTFLGYEDPIRSKLTLSNDDRPKVSLWTVLKSMIGKDMTKMTLPVVFNEPTSLLQRVAEDVECSELLDKATTFDDSTLRLLYVSVFTASCYASTVGRIAKPFNPLLGETFEYCRPEKNYRFFSEQVSHHPPISATWTESPKWDFFGESIVDTNFNGRQFNVKHLGMWHIKLRPDCNNQEELYTYKKPDNTVVGILVGNPQVDNHGEVKIVNHTNGEYCIMNFKARGWRSSNAYEVKGEVYDKNKKKVWVFGGHWNDSIYGKKITGKSNDEIEINSKKNNKNVDNGPNFDGEKFLIWKANQKYNSPFNLTQFAISLNAPQPHLLPWLPPTDTRLRPDQRAMEDGEYDKAAAEKHKVEEKQRAAKRKRDAEHIKYEPRYFEHAVHPITKQPYWKFKGSYWNLRRDKKLSDAGDIF